MFWIVTCFMYPRVFTKEGSCGDCCLSCDSPQNILGLGPLKALIRPCVWALGTEVPVESSGEAQVGGLGTNPVGGMANEVPQKLTILGLSVYIFFAKYVNNFIF